MPRRREARRRQQAHPLLLLQLLLLLLATAAAAFVSNPAVAGGGARARRPLWLRQQAHPRRGSVVVAAMAGERSNGGSSGSGAGAAVLDRPVREKAVAAAVTAATQVAPAAPAPVDKKEDEEDEQDDRVKVAAFLRWLRENGAHFDRLCWPSYDTASGSRGAVATADIRPGESLLELPERLLLTPPAALDAPWPLGPALEDCLGEMTDEEVLAVFLMHELGRGPASFYHPYLAILPRDGRLLSCIEWTEEEIAACQDPWLVAEVRRRRKEMEAQYARVVDGVLRARHPEVFGDDMGTFSFGAFKYTMLIVQSRAFGRRLPFPSLVPLADLLNHANTPIMYGLVDAPRLDQRQQEPQQHQPQPQQQRVFRLYPNGGQGVRQGQEVCNSYGRRGNRHFLLHYAFALPDNEWDAVELAVPPIPATSGSAVQAAILALGERAGAVCRPTHALTATGFNWELLCYARAVMLAEQQQQQPVDVDLTRPLPLAQERAVLRRLGRLLEEALAAFPTSLEADEAALPSVGCPRRRATITYRVTRKRILHQHWRAVAALLGFVEGGDGDGVLGVWEGLFGGGGGELRAYVECVSKC